jgi:G6PDH family F420-dependent oxidoreductase
MAEQAGFDALWISDHYHPWNDAQGQSSFVWSMIGAIGQTCRLPVTTAVTCPTVRIHPAIVAQAAATSNVLLEGRFSLGVGTGEALNEHVTTARWPNIDVRLDMLEEAVGVMRALWSGEYVSHHGQHYSVENARIYTRTEQPPPIYVSGFGPKSAELAGRIGDGYISTQPDRELLQRFRDNGGEGKPAQAGYKVCWSSDEKVAVATAHRLWATSDLPGELSQVLPSPRHFEQVSALVTEPDDGRSGSVRPGCRPACPRLPTVRRGGLRRGVRGANRRRGSHIAERGLLPGLCGQNPSAAAIGGSLIPPGRPRGRF